MIYDYRPEIEAEIEPFFHQGTTILVFSAPWCGTCRAIRRTMREYTEQNAVPVVFIDVDRDKKLRDQYQIQGVPVLILLEAGKVLGRTAGSLDFEEFTAWVSLTRQSNP
jgi:thioredoxin-like negative regulator of GroEL